MQSELKAKYRAAEFENRVMEDCEEVKVAVASQAADTIVKTLHQGEPGGTIVINQVIKAGSLGHGTAVPGHYDLDLVIYSSSVEPFEALRNGFHQWLLPLRQHLDRKLPHKLSERNQAPNSVQFKYDGRMDVDMLISPFWGEEPTELYRFLKKIPQKDRFTFSCNASKWQVEFFKHQPNQVKEFIKRAKAWRNVMWKREKYGKPKSFLLSVIVLRAYETAEKKILGDMSTKRIAWHTTAEVKEIVRNNGRADIYWEEYYSKHNYPDLFPRSLPRIVDPANPSNNLHDTGICGPSNTKAHDYGEGGGRWDNFVRFVDSLDLTKSVEEIQQ